MAMNEDTVTSNASMDITAGDSLQRLRRQGLSTHKSYQSEDEYLLQKDYLVREAMNRSESFVYDTGLTKSRYDPSSASMETLQNLEDYRAQQQSSFAKIANGFVKMEARAATTAAMGVSTLTLGLLSGGIGVIGRLADREWYDKHEGDLFNGRVANNGFNRYLNDIYNFYEDSFQNHRRNGEDQMSIIKRMGTANFWADDIITNMGFTRGAAKSGQWFSTALGKVAGAALSSPAGKAFQMLATATYSALGEAAIESMEVYDDMYNGFNDVLRGEFQNKAIDLKNRYLNGEITADQYAQEAKALNNDVSESMAHNRKKAVEASNANMAIQTMILSITDAKQFMRLWYGGFKTGRMMEREVKRDWLHNGYKASKTALGDFGAAGKTMLTEGIEEFSQELTKSTVKGAKSDQLWSYYSNGHNWKKAQEAAEMMHGGWDGFKQSITSKEAWDSFIIGAISGGIGLPGMRKTTTKDGKTKFVPDFTTGAIGSYMEHRAARKAEESIAKAMTDRVNDPNTAAYYQGLIRRASLEEDMQRYLETGDAYNYKNSEFQSLMSDIMLFAKVGRLNDLKALASSAFSLEKDEDVQELIDNAVSTTDNGTTVSPFKGKSVDEVRASIKANRRYLMENIARYEDIMKTLDYATDERFSDTQLEELTMMAAQMEDWKERYAHLFDDITGDGSIQQQFREALDEDDLTDEAKARIKELLEVLDCAESLYSTADKPGFFSSRRYKHHGTVEIFEKFVSQRGADLVKEINLQKDGININAETLTKLNDMVQLAKSMYLFNSKFNSYLSNPGGMAKEEQIAVKEMIKKNQQTFFDIAKSQLEALGDKKSAAAYKQVLSQMGVHDRGTIKKILDSMEGDEVAESIKRLLKDRDAVEAIVDKIIADNPDWGEGKWNKDDLKEVIEILLDNITYKKDSIDGVLTSTIKDYGMDLEIARKHSKEDAEELYGYALYTLQKSYEQLNKDRNSGLTINELAKWEGDPNSKNGVKVKSVPISDEEWNELCKAIIDTSEDHDVDVTFSQPAENTPITTSSSSTQDDGNGNVLQFATKYLVEAANWGVFINMGDVTVDDLKFWTAIYSLRKGGKSITGGFHDLDSFKMANNDDLVSEVISKMNSFTKIDNDRVEYLHALYNMMNYLRCFDRIDLKSVKDLPLQFEEIDLGHNNEKVLFAYVVDSNGNKIYIGPANRGFEDKKVHITGIVNDELERDGNWYFTSYLTKDVATHIKGVMVCSGNDVHSFSIQDKPMQMQGIINPNVNKGRVFVAVEKDDGTCVPVPARVNKIGHIDSQSAFVQTIKDILSQMAAADSTQSFQALFNNLNKLVSDLDSTEGDGLHLTYVEGGGIKFKKPDGEYQIVDADNEDLWAEIAKRYPRLSTSALSSLGVGVASEFFKDLIEYGGLALPSKSLRFVNRLYKFEIEGENNGSNDSTNQSSQPTQTPQVQEVSERRAEKAKTNFKDRLNGIDTTGLVVQIDGKDVIIVSTNQYIDSEGNLHTTEDLPQSMRKVIKDKFLAYKLDKAGFLEAHVINKDNNVTSYYYKYDKESGTLIAVDGAGNNVNVTDEMRIQIMYLEGTTQGVESDNTTLPGTYFKYNDKYYRVHRAHEGEYNSTMVVTEYTEDEMMQEEALKQIKEKVDNLKFAPRAADLKFKGFKEALTEATNLEGQTIEVDGSSIQFSTWDNHAFFDTMSHTLFRGKSFRTTINGTEFRFAIVEQGNEKKVFVIDKNGNATAVINKDTNTRSFSKEATYSQLVQRAYETAKGDSLFLNGTKVDKDSNGKNKTTSLTYTIGGKKHLRVHTLFNPFSKVDNKGNVTAKKDGVEKGEEPITEGDPKTQKTWITAGNDVDTISRDFFIEVEKGTPLNEIKSKLTKPISTTQEAFEQLVEELVSIIEYNNSLDDSNPKKVTHFHSDRVMVDFYDKDTGLGVAGEIDLLLEHADGTFTVVDFKTTANAKSLIDGVDKDGNTNTLYTNYRMQVYMYTYMLRLKGYRMNIPQFMLYEIQRLNETPEDGVNILQGVKRYEDYRGAQSNPAIVDDEQLVAAMNGFLSRSGQGNRLNPVQGKPTTNNRNSSPTSTNTPTNKTVAPATQTASTPASSTPTTTQNNATVGSNDEEINDPTTQSTQPAATSPTTTTTPASSDNSSALSDEDKAASATIMAMLNITPNAANAAIVNSTDSSTDSSGDVTSDASTSNNEGSTQRPTKQIIDEDDSRLRSTSLSDAGGKVWNREEELEVLRRMFPKIAEEDRIKIVKGLINIKGSTAYGIYDLAKGLITLSDVAEKGTLYHEAFHAIFHLVLTSQEREALLKDAAAKWGSDLSAIEKEEELAEAFRKYVITQEEDRTLGRRILKFFENIFTKMTHFMELGHNTTYLFNQIYQGKFASREFSTILDSSEIKDDNNIRTRIVQGKRSSVRAFEYKNLSESMQKQIHKLGWSQEDYDKMPDEMKESINRCYAF